MNKIIKVIDLLNKIANGEEVPKKIKYQGVTFTLEEEVYYVPNELYSLIDYIKLKERDLNDCAEIIEEDNKIEKLDLYDETHLLLNDYMNYDMAKYKIHKSITEFTYKINEIIDEINSMKEK